MDPDGRYRTKPARTLKEWKEKQKKVWGRNDDLLFCKKAEPLTRSKRKPKYKVNVLEGSIDKNVASIQQIKKKLKKPQESTSKSKERCKKKVQVLVKTCLDSSCVLQVLPKTSVQEVKAEIGCQLGLAEDKFNLYHRQFKLEDRLSLEDQGITDDASIEMRLVNGLKGGADKPAGDETTSVPSVQINDCGGDTSAETLDPNNGSGGATAADTSDPSIASGGVKTADTPNNSSSGATAADTSDPSIASGGVKTADTSSNGSGGATAADTSDPSIASGGVKTADTSSNGSGGATAADTLDPSIASGGAKSADTSSNGSGGDTAADTSDPSIASGGVKTADTSSNGSGGATAADASDPSIASGGVKTADTPNNSSSGATATNTSNPSIASGGVKIADTSSNGSGGATSGDTSDPSIASGGAKTADTPSICSGGATAADTSSPKIGPGRETKAETSDPNIGTSGTTAAETEVATAEKAGIRSYYGTCNQQSLDIDYMKYSKELIAIKEEIKAIKTNKAKKKKKEDEKNCMIKEQKIYRGDRVKQTVNTLLAFLNSKHGGILTLVNTNQHETTNEEPWFDDKMIERLGPRGVDVDDYIVTLGNIYGAKYYFFVKAVDVDVTFSPIISYFHDRTMNRTEEKKKKEHICAILHRPSDEIPTLRDYRFKFGEHHKGLAESDQIEFKCPQDNMADAKWKDIHKALNGPIKDLVDKKQTGHVIYGLLQAPGDVPEKYVIYGIPLSDKSIKGQPRKIREHLEKQTFSKNTKDKKDFQFEVNFIVVKCLYVLVVSVKYQNNKSSSPILDPSFSLMLGKIYKLSSDERVLDLNPEVYQLSKAAKLDTDAIHEKLRGLLSKETSGFIVYGFTREQTDDDTAARCIGIPVLHEKNYVDVITKLTFTFRGIQKASFCEKDENGYFHLQCEDRVERFVRLKITFLSVSPGEFVNKVILLSLDCNNTLPESGFGLVKDQCLKYGQALPEHWLTWLKIKLCSFVFSARNIVTEQFESDFERYIPAFANNRGGHLIFGIEDNGNVVGYHDIIDEEEYKRTLQRKIQKRLHVFQVKPKEAQSDDTNTEDESNFSYYSKEEARSKVQPEITFIPVGKSPSGLEKKIIVVSVKRLVKGIVFTQPPEIPVWLTGSEKCKYELLNSEECCHVLQAFYKKDKSLEPVTELPESRFKELELHGVGVGQQTEPYFERLRYLRDHHPFQLREALFKTEKGSYHIISSIPRDNHIQEFLETQKLTKKCDSNEEGIIVVTALKSQREFSRIATPPAPDICADIILVSSTKGAHLITLYKEPRDNFQHIEQYSKTMAAQLDKLFKACHRKGTCQRYVLVRHIVHKSKRFKDINFSNPQVPAGMRTCSRFDFLLDSVAIIMSTINVTLQSLSNFMHILTLDQSELLWHGFETHKTLFVHGAAGTGKTVIAMEVARKLADVYGPDTVLYLCVTTPLKEFVRRNLNRAVLVETLSSFCAQWEKSQTNAFVTVQHIIADEAHNYRVGEEINFGIDWYDVVCKLQGTGNQRGYLWVFCDMNQRGYSKETGLPSLKNQANKYKTYKLRHVVRCTKSVFKVLQGDMRDAKPTLSHDFGGSISFFPYVNCVKMIEELVNKHTVDCERPYADIVVLTSNKKKVEELKRSLRRQGIHTVSADHRDSETGMDLVVDSIFRYGGLEKSVVIVVDYTVPGVYDPKGFKYQVLTRTSDIIYFIRPHRSKCLTRSVSMSDIQENSAPVSDVQCSASVSGSKKSVVDGQVKYGRKMEKTTLARCADNWELFCAQKEKVDDFLPIPSKLWYFDRDIHESMIDSRFVALCEKNMVPLKVDPNGNSLYNSISKLLIGCECLSNDLRLFSAIYGARHAKQYINQYYQQLTTLRDCQTFMHDVSADIQYKQPLKGNHVTRRDIIKYTIQTAVLETANRNKYEYHAGSLQILFLAGYLQMEIRCYTPEPRPGPSPGLSMINTDKFEQFLPCTYKGKAGKACFDNTSDKIPVLNIMMTERRGDACTNHYIGIVAEDGKQINHKRADDDAEGI